MNRQASIAFLRALNGKHIKEGSDWIQTSCVLAPWKHRGGVDRHPSAALKVASGDSGFYYCFGCGSYSLVSLLFELRRLGACLPLYDLQTATGLVMEDTDKPSITLRIGGWERPPEMPEVFFSERWLASFYRATDSVAAMSYLATRQITHRVIELLDLRYDSSLNAVGFPIRNFSGVLCGMRARIIAPAPEQPRYHVYRTSDGRHNQFAFLGESMLDFDKPIVMTESVFDLASVLRVYPNVCAPMSAAVSRGRLKRLNRVVELVTLFDADSAGDRARKTVRAALSDAYITDVFPTDGCKDAGEMSVVQLVALLKRYVDVTDQEVKTL